MNFVKINDLFDSSWGNNLVITTNKATNHYPNLYLASMIVVIIASDNVFSLVQCQTIVWTNGDHFPMRPWGTNFCEIWVKIQNFSSRKCIWKCLTKKWPFCWDLHVLTHWGWVMHICIGNLTISSSDNGLSPGWHRAITWTNAEILSIGPLGTNFSQIFIRIQIFSFKKMHLEMSSASMC